MRNIYECYKMCKHIYDKSEKHNCDNKDCPAQDYDGTFSASYKTNRYSKIINRIRRKKAPNKDSQNRVLMKFAYAREYISVEKCSKRKMNFATLTTKGLELTDNLFLPFTPIGLWKEIWVEHKIIISFVYSFIVLLFGGTLAIIAKLIHGLFNSVG